MARYLKPCLPLPLDEKVVKDIAEKAKDYALMHGAGMRSKDDFSSDSLVFAPFLLLPSTFPRKEFNKVVELQTVVNHLVHKVAHDYEFLKSSLRNTIKVDDFTGRLFSIYDKVREEGVSQRVSLGLIRSDIMLESHQNGPSKGCVTSQECAKYCQLPSNPPPFCCWKQVELNTIASGFGWLGPVSSDIHSLLLGDTSRVEVCLGYEQDLSLGLLRSDYFVDEPEFGVKQVEINTVASSFGALSTALVDVHRYTLAELGHTEMLQNLPDNGALQGLCEGMLKAWEIYCRPSSAILFIVEDVTFNICDQRFHEFEIRRQNPLVKVLRKTLTEVHTEGTLDLERRLLINGTEIAVVYFRAGYTPDHYFSNAEWDARLMIERSLAIKCPSIHYHLAGTKKVQQELAKEGTLQRFLSDPDEISAVQATFTGLFSLDEGEEGDRAIELGMSHPENYVLKPQREGGGNNIYDEEVRTYLEKIKDSEERSGWILMERIHPPLQKNYMLRPALAEPLFTDFVSELGIFGVIIGDSKEIFTNKQVGHMLRTKVSSANEGGVAAGWGALDSVYLVDPQDY